VIHFLSSAQFDPPVDWIL